MQNSDFKTRLTSLYGSQNSSVGLSTHNSVLSSRIKRLYGFQPSPVVLCMQYSDFSTRITSLCEYKTPPVVFECKTAPFGTELEVSMGSSPHMLFCALKTETLELKLHVSLGTDLQVLDWNKKYLSHRCNLSFCASNQSDLHQNDKFIMVPALISCKTATLRPDLQVCMGPRPHMWVWAHITACLVKNKKTIWVPAFTCGFVHAKQWL